MVSFRCCFDSFETRNSKIEVKQRASKQSQNEMSQVETFQHFKNVLSFEAQPGLAFTETETK